MAKAQYIPAVMSVIGTPILAGALSGCPVTLISPDIPWAMRSRPGHVGVRPGLAEAGDGGVDDRGLTARTLAASTPSLVVVPGR